MIWKVKFDEATSEDKNFIKLYLWSSLRWFLMTCVVAISPGRFSNSLFWNKSIPIQYRYNISCCHRCPMPDAIKSTLVLGARYHPYHQIVSGNRLKTTDVAEDFIWFEPDTDPMPWVPNANLTIESVWIGFPMPSLPLNFIVIGCHRPPNVPGLVAIVTF
jgi:hypothetical protein